ILRRKPLPCWRWREWSQVPESRAKDFCDCKMRASIGSLSSTNPGTGLFHLVQIVKVHCPRCGREFRTVPTVIEHAGTVYCPRCGARMNVSEPHPVSVLSQSNKASAA